MNLKEQEIALSELEERVDRLRNIYEQYFLGFEKIEPMVPRKDVDRRFALLRKEQIRNTAVRFRFQMVTQRYNTYAMHWVRICRQIEAGTYKRHLRKAKARFEEPSIESKDSVEFEVDVDVEVGTQDLAQAEPVAVVGSTVPRLALFAPPIPYDEVSRVDPVVAVPRPLLEREVRGATLPAGAKPLLLRKRELAAKVAPRAVEPALTPAPAADSLPTTQKGLQRGVQGAPHASPKLRPLNPAGSMRARAPSSESFDPVDTVLPATGGAAPPTANAVSPPVTGSVASSSRASSPALPPPLPVRPQGPTVGPRSPPPLPSRAVPVPTTPATKLPAKKE